MGKPEKDIEVEKAVDAVSETKPEEKAPEVKKSEPKKPVEKKMSDAEKLKQLVSAVHFLASMMPAEVFKQAVDNFPVLKNRE